MTKFFKTPQILPHTILYLYPLYHSLSCSVTCTGHDFIMQTLQDSWRVAPYLGAQAGMFALRERRQHVTQEDFEMAVSKVMKCLVTERTWKNKWMAKMLGRVMAKIITTPFKGVVLCFRGRWSKNLFLRRFQRNLGGAADSISDSNPDFPPQIPAPLTKERFRQEHEFDAADEVPLCLFFGSFFLGCVFRTIFGSLRLLCSIAGLEQHPQFLGKLPGVNTCSLLAEVVLSLTIRTTGPSDRGLGNIAGTSDIRTGQQ